MKCPRCQEFSRVLETRDGATRRRECPQGHRFWTHEEWIKDVPQKRDYAALRVEVVRLVKENMKPKRIAAMLGLKTETVYRLRKGATE